VPAEVADLVEPKLRAHGIEYRRLDTPLSASLQAYRAHSSSTEDHSTEGHNRLKLAGKWGEEKRELVAGALYVPIAQAKARLVMALLEPQAPDSLLAWGEFNNFYERKEYMEAYVTEDVARDMLAKDPALAKDFAERLRTDAKFAADPGARLDYFYRRHSAWDERYRLYPVLRTDVEPAR